MFSFSEMSQYYSSTFLTLKKVKKKNFDTFILFIFILRFLPIKKNKYLVFQNKKVIVVKGKICIL